MSNNSKGADLERKAIAMLEAQGYRVHRTRRAPILKWGGDAPKVIGSASNDIFNAFDLVATHRVHGFLWVQVTDSDHAAARRDKVQAEVGDFREDSAVEVWGWVGGAKRRHQQTGEFVRRQYFRRYAFDFATVSWVEVTPPDVGWPDRKAAVVP